MLSSYSGSAQDRLGMKQEPIKSSPVFPGTPLWIEYRGPKIQTLKSKTL